MKDKENTVKCIFKFSCLLAISASIFLSSCGGGSGNAPGGGNNNNNQPSISVTPASASVLVGQTASLTANVQNVTDTRVSWAVQETAGGTITPTNSGAVYTAPWPVGTYHVVVTSVGNTSLTATATISVSAQFAFMQAYPGGDATPFSMTPQIGTYAPNGTFSLAGIIDTGTGHPVSVAMESLMLSSDGTKGVFNTVTTENTYDVYIANANGSGDAKQLTTDGDSWYPEFSANGQQIVYIRGSDIWAMNVDGSNQHVVYPAGLNGDSAYSATFSRDGTRIAAELEWSPGGVYTDGIAIMNADGSKAVPLTGGSDFPCSIGWDEAPAFTHDGTQIIFSRYCDDNYTGTLYTINIDGTGLAPLYAATAAVVHYNPIPVADKIVFQTNRDFAGSGAPIPFEIYSMKADGSAVTRLTNNTLFDGFDLNWWNSGGSSAYWQQSLRVPANRASLHGAARRVERIKKMQLHRR